MKAITVITVVVVCLVATGAWMLWTAVNQALLPLLK
jgi:hypothetical protein